MTGLPSSFAPLFRAQLQGFLSSAPKRPESWVYAPYDQLTDRVGPLRKQPIQKTGLILIESEWKARQRPYHRQKLALVLANQRHFALEQAALGRPVRYVFARGSYADALGPLAKELGPLFLMEPAEWELREHLAPLVQEGALQVLPHAGWLTERAAFVAGTGAQPPWRMDRFYRHVRQASGYLMTPEGKPVGGNYSYDAENRLPWKGQPDAPEPLTFSPDAITLEVVEFVADRFADHPGQVDPSRLPATHQDAEALWEWAKLHCLPQFGPYEDAFSEAHSSLFHTLLSPLLNLHRLLPKRVIDEALALDLPLPSQEGFLRQILGWREFVRHVHRETEGFRNLPGVPNEAPADSPPYGEWQAKPGASPSWLRTEIPLPPAYWGEPSGLRCLDHTVAQVWREGYTHHIPRLMVLANIATLLGASPRQLTDWFWVAFVDAYDWVVEPNVLAMGTFSAGEVMTTKPYVSGAAYLHRMGDHCGPCGFHPKKNCPITGLYWSFLARNRERLQGNHRMAMPMRALEKRSAQRLAWDTEVSAQVQRALAAGKPLDPEDFSDVP